MLTWPVLVASRCFFQQGSSRVIVFATSSYHYAETSLPTVGQTIACFTISTAKILITSRILLGSPRTTYSEKASYLAGENGAVVQEQSGGGSEQLVVSRVRRNKAK